MKLQGSTQSSLKDYLNQMSLEFGSKKARVKMKVKSEPLPRILIVDDEWNILKLLYSYLSQNYELIVKSSPIEAFKWLQEGNLLSLIICEYELPHFNSPLFIQAVKASGLYQNIPVIILSGTEGFEEKLDKLPFAVEAAIKKPFDPGSLKNTIQKIINGNKSRLSR